MEPGAGLRSKAAGAPGRSCIRVYLRMVEGEFLSKPGDISGGRGSEEPSILPAELRNARVPDAIASDAYVHSCGYHESPRLLKAKGLLILQRTHRRRRFEVLVERGYAHIRQRRELRDLHRIGEMRA